MPANLQSFYLFLYNSLQAFGCFTMETLDQLHFHWVNQWGLRFCWGADLYTAFIVLYPIGVGPGEMWLMYQALPVIKERNLYADRLPFSYYNFVLVVLILYPVLWLKLYLHLFKQRRSKLGKRQKTKRG